MARVPLLEADQAHPKVREIFQKIEANGHQIVNLYKVLAHSPELCTAFIRFGNKILFRGALPPPLRELAILRVSEVTDANYERTKHIEIAGQVGVPEAKIKAIPDWSGSEAFDDLERAVLQYTDEVTRNVRVSEETFAQLRKHLDDAAVVELTVTIGFYNMVSRILESLQVELEEEGTPPF